MAEIPPLLPFPYGSADSADGHWVIRGMPSNSRLGERQQEAADRFLSSFLALQRSELRLLEDLNQASQEKRPLVVYVEGFEPDVDLMFALMRCAYQFGVPLVFDPGPVPEERGPEISADLPIPGDVP